ncbi:MAG: T9SS type A sorting domain-containing protein [Calditrichaeota bacterium]|nr:T9SS type A sorting domain-containing protein [Calditrichota bacterium]
MKRIALLWIAVLPWVHLAKADTTFVAGVVSGTWTVEGSPYIVQGNLTIEDSSALAIEPGVRVYFEGPFEVTVGPTSAFSAIGTESDSILFTSEATPDSLRWGGLYLNRSPGLTVLSYCIFENATGKSQVAAVNSFRTDITIEHSNFRDNIGALATHDVHGAALHIDDSWSQPKTCTIRDCIFENNHGTHGGAVGLQNANGTIERCIFRDNFAGAGGAIYGLGPTVQIVECLFENNETGEGQSSRGGAIWYEGNWGQVIGCEFIQNHTHGIGGAICDTWGGTAQNRARYEDCVFRGNTSGTFGGALGIAGFGTVKKCLFDSNQSATGGALAYFGTNLLNVTQCTFVMNTAMSGLSVIISESQPVASLRVANSVFAYNSGGWVFSSVDCAETFFKNNAIWGNEWPVFETDFCPERHVVYEVNVNGDSCDFDDNLYLDPLFVDPENGDFHLQEGSPLIDAGIAGQIYETTSDPDSTTPDIGLFYFHQTPSAYDEHNEVVHAFALLQNYPNPFNGETTIEFELPARTHARLDLFDITGRFVRSLYDGNALGRTSVHVSLDGLASGIYIYRLTTPEEQLSNKMLLIR